MAGKDKIAEIEGKLERARKTLEDRQRKAKDSEKCVRDLEQRLKAAKKREAAERDKENVAEFEKIAGTNLGSLTPEQLEKLAQMARGMLDESEEVVGTEQETDQNGGAATVEIEKEHKEEPQNNQPSGGWNTWD